MHPSLRHKIQNVAQSLLLLAGMAALGWVILSTVAGPELTLAVILGTVGGLMVSPGIPRRMLLRSYGARRLTAQDFPEGLHLLEMLARKAGLPRVPELYYIPSQLPNAFAVGSPQDSAVCVSDGLLRVMTRRELAGVLAHEVAHIANRDLWLMGLADVLSRVVSLAAWVGQLILVLNLPLILIGAAYVPWHVPVLLVLSPTIMAVLQLALSRTREFDADRGGAELTGDPEGLAAALMKLERRTGRAWEDIFLPGRRIPVPSLLRTHPPTEERVQRLRELTGRGTHFPDDAPIGFRQSGGVPAPRFGPWGVYR
ncbi:putative protease HtpX family protein [Ruegeria lacuscaerulensis ITI-1157]|nr:putative protease HtpX family protein [Ruegeria lacuscaerulensis ITI-1157]SHJ07626.1 heat shock protein HtpX [Ruegeria lacuscaerulensis ITI-1157]